MNDYRRSLTPFPFVDGKNSESRYKGSVWMARGVDALFWLISTLSFVLGLASLSTNVAWGIALLVSAVLVCPLVPVHFVAKLCLSAFSVFPPSLALSLSVGIGGLWLTTVLRGPASDNDA